MKINPFALERYFARYEFSAPYLLSSSDCEALFQEQLLRQADEEMAAAWQQLRLGYTESRGHPLLLAEIAGLYSEVDETQALVSAPEEAIFLFMHALLEPGDHVVCTFPGYQSLYELARAIGCQVSYWQPHEARGWEFALADLRQLLREETRLVVFNFPHNPTGYQPERDEFIAMVNLVRQHGAYLLSDEMYRYLDLGEGERLPAACELYERAVSLSGLSKAYGLAGLRIGWLAGQDRDLLERVLQLKDYTTICSSAPSEILAVIALRNRETLIREQRKRLKRNLAHLETFFLAYEDIFAWQRPRAGSVCFPRLLAASDTFVFCEEVVDQAGILLVPSRVFQFGHHHLRVGFGRENLPQVLDHFSNYLERRFRS